MEGGKGRVWFGVEEGEEDVRREDVAQEGILVPDERECFCKLGLCVGVVLEGLGGGGSHGGLLGRSRRRGLLLDGAEEGTHYVS